MTERSQTIVVGAGVGGLGAALALSRAGHRVTLIERDATPLPADAEAAFAWDRRGAPQVRHSHALLARLRNLLRDHHPDVLADLLAAGATEIRFTENLPADITDREPRDGDEDLVALACRRTTFEWVLRRAVLADPDVTLIDGVVVDRLLVDGTRAGDEAVPRVTGVGIRSTADGEHHQELLASTVVAAIGRRSAVPRWLAGIGVHPTSDEEDTGIVYLSRFYRLHADAEPPPTDGQIGGDLGYLKYAVFQGDNRTFSVTLAVGTDDQELRALVLAADGFDQVASMLPMTVPWVEPERSGPITPVHVMAGLLNRRVDYLDESGRPLVLGFHAVGDAHTCTNPLYGRGCSLALVQASLLADAWTEHPNDAVARAVAYEQASFEQVLPWYQASVTQDRLNREQAARATESATRSAAAPTADDPGDGPGAAGTEADPKAFLREIMRDGLMPAVRTDAGVYRAFVRVLNLLEAPDTLMHDAHVVNRVLAAYAERDARAPEPPLGPPRSEMIDRLTAG